jgi:hypothetical protein
MSGILPAITRYSTHRLARISAVPPVEIAIDVVSRHALAALVLFTGLLFMIDLPGKFMLFPVQLFNQVEEPRRGIGLLSHNP